MSVESDINNKYLDPEKTGDMDPRLVARLMLTNDSVNLDEFYINPGAALDGALRLSYGLLLFATFIIVICHVYMKFDRLKNWELNFAISNVQK